MVQRLIFLICAFTSVAAAQSAPPRKDIPAIAKAANGSVVSIVMSDGDGKPVAQGSGFFVSKDLVVTNYYVIAEGKSAVLKIPIADWEELAPVVGVVAFDKKRDIAVIKSHDKNPHVLTLGNSDRVQVGQEVVAIGNPLSLESTVSNGIVSGLRTVDELGGKFLQITAPISPGSSGGPLFNMAGEVIGITTAGLKGGENLNFAIPINDAKHLIASADDPWAVVKNFPNEPKAGTSSAAPAETHDTKQQQEKQACNEQAKKFEHSNKPEADSASVNGLGPVGRCYIEIGSYKVVRQTTVVTRDWKTELRDIIPYPVWLIQIYDASSEGDDVPYYGWLVLEYKPERYFECHIYPTGTIPLKQALNVADGLRKPENTIGCRSKKEFDDLASKHFGLPPLEGIRFPEK